MTDNDTIELKHTETYEDKIKRLPKVLEAYAKDAQKDCYWKGDSDLAPVLKSAAKYLRADRQAPQDVEALKKIANNFRNPNNDPETFPYSFFPNSPSFFAELLRHQERKAKPYYN